jgi:hypothetical protein
MPEISRFFGIVIQMYWSDHPRPHFHAIYGDRRATFAIETLDVTAGSLPGRLRGFVLEWAAEHREELRANWQRAQRREVLLPIPPLE